MTQYFALLLALVIANPIFAAPFAYVSYDSDNLVMMLDLANGNELAKVTVGKGPQTIVLNSAAAKAYVSNSKDNSISVINTDSNSVIKTIAVGQAPQQLAITSSGNKLYLANSNSISIIDTASDTVTNILPISSSSALAVNPEGLQVYIANDHLNTVTVLDTATDKIINVIKVGRNPQDVEFNPIDAKAYVVNYDNQTIDVIDTVHYRVIDTITLGTAPEAIAVNPTGKSIYVTTSNALLVIDASSNQIVDRIFNPDDSLQLSDIEINSTGTEAYLTSSETNQIIVVDLVNTNFKELINTGSHPFNIALSPESPKIAKKIADDAIVCLFNWAEDQFPYYFSAPLRNGYSTQYPYSFRYYVHTNFYLGVSATDEHLYYLPSGANRKPIDAGLFSYWQEQAGCGAGLPTITSFTATPNPVESGGSTNLQWSSTNTTVCTSNAWGTDLKGSTGSFGITNLTSNQTYNLTCNGTGGSISATVKVTVNSPNQTNLPETKSAPTISSFTVTPNPLDYNGSTTLQWSSTNATGCTSNAWSGSLGASGSKVLSGLTSDQTYNLTCTGSGGTANSSVSVTVKPPVVVTPAPTISSFTASPNPVDYNGSTTLQWSSSNATGCTSNAWSGSLGASGSKVLSGLTSDQTYNLTCTGSGGTANSSVSVTVKPPVVVTPSGAYKIGDKGPAGGIVFNVDATGQHGLEAQPKDANVGGSTGSSSIWEYPDGSLQHFYTWSEALTVAQSYGAGWHLPTKDELNLLYLQKSVVGVFDDYVSFWSSTEYSADDAWGHNFSLSFQTNYGKVTSLRVRAVRAF